MPSQKRVYIIHGWGGSPDEGWLPWLAEKLAEKGFSVKVPEMPGTDNPKIGAWVSHLQKIVGRCDADTFFVGHSIGCQAIMRYLEKIPGDEKAGGAVFVAGWLTLSNIDSQEERMTSSPWLNTPIDFSKIKQRAEKFSCIFSDDDPYVPKENGKLFSEKLGAKLITLKNTGHFSGEDGINELPGALEELLRIAKKL